MRASVRREVLRSQLSLLLFCDTRRNVAITSSKPAISPIVTLMRFASMLYRYGPKKADYIH